MRSLIAMLLLVVCSPVLAEEAPQIDWDPLLRVPNLAPALTEEEVAKDFTPWAERIRKSSTQPKSEAERKVIREAVLGARKALADRIPKVVKITLFAIHPTKREDLKKQETDRAAALVKLPAFQGYPVLSSIVIENPEEANRWAGMLRDQVGPGPMMLCGFEPRHGFRFSTAEGDTDVLMCFVCAKLALAGGKPLDEKYTPIFSRVVKDLVNQLFDKRKLERDTSGDK